MQGISENGGPKEMPFKLKMFSEVPMFCHFVPSVPNSHPDGIYYLFKKVTETTGICHFITGRIAEFKPDDLVIYMVID